MTDLSLLNQLPCANTDCVVDGKISPCLKQASNICKGCFLVQYCSRECQLSHWSLHKSDCKSPFIKATWKPSYDIENRPPAFVGYGYPFDQHGVRKYLWGNVPALDIINHIQNEGVNLAENYGLLFAASGDIRNIVKTVAGLPKAYVGQCDIVVNDRDLDIIARNLILLLIALHFTPDKATTMMLHIWYSALIPKQVFCSLQDNIFPLVQEVCVKIRGKSATSLQSKIWRFGSRSLRLVLQKQQWDRILSYFQVPDGLSTARAREIRLSTTLAKERTDYLERALYNEPAAWRICTMKFRKDGILLPFGLSRRNFDTPNPTLYQENSFWPMMDSADPLSGWPLGEVIQKLPSARNDIYGGLFMYLQEVLQEFCDKTQRLAVQFQLYQADASDLPGLIKQYGMGCNHFDRIELSNIADRGYLGPQRTLATFGPLLKRKTQNPHAIILTLFLNAVHEVSTDMDQVSSLMSGSDRLRQYLRVTPNTFQDRNSSNAEMVRFIAACKIFHDYDELFQRFMNECPIQKYASAVGLEMKSRNTVIDPWPWRLKTNATQEEFNLLLASGLTGSERYIEWKSIE